MSSEKFDTNQFDKSPFPAFLSSLSEVAQTSFASADNKLNYKDDRRYYDIKAMKLKR